MATRLVKLQIREVSGVDDPANQAPGHLVVKARERAENAVPVKIVAADDGHMLARGFLYDDLNGQASVAIEVKDE